MSTFIHLMRGQMSKPLDELGGKCPYMPFLDRGQMSEGEYVRPPSFLFHSGDKLIVHLLHYKILLRLLTARDFKMAYH